MHQSNANKSRKWKAIMMTCIMAAGLYQFGGLEVKAAEQTARIGESFYETLEEAFQAATDGETIYLQKDTALSATITVAGANITLLSEDQENPCFITSDDSFDATQPLLIVESGSFITRDIILDGQAVIDNDFINTGKTVSNSLIAVEGGSYTMEQGTVLQNNYNTDGVSNNLAKRTAGAINITENGTFVLTDGLIKNCYTNGAGGGILIDGSDTSLIAGGKITHCMAAFGGAIYAEADISVEHVEIKENQAQHGGGIYASGNITIEDCEISNNEASATAGGISCKVNDNIIHIKDCLLFGNKANSGAALDAVDNTMTGEVILKYNFQVG